MNRIRAGLFALTFLLLAGNASVFGQSREFTPEIRFIQYLIDKEQFTEADFLLEKLDQRLLGAQQLDTINYLKGWSAYTDKRLDTAMSSLARVSPDFPWYVKSHFFAAYSAGFLGKRDTAISLLRQLPSRDSVTNEMRSFQLSGLSLLNRDYNKYMELKKDFTYSLFALQKEEENFNAYYSKLTTYKHKSPVLAGIYSAVIPGAGKFYAGKKKQGVAAFLPILSLGILTYEAYRKSGIKSARTITFGSLFSVFYIGNIWGSVLSVKIKDKEFYREYDNKILFDMHIPLRNLYN